MNSTKIDGILHHTLKSLGQFLFFKIIYLNFHVIIDIS
jgi:hypothetical protein